MLRKSLGGAAVAALIFTLAAPASAGAPTRVARLRNTTTHAVAGSANLGWTGTKWRGSVHVRAGALAPGDYVYGAVLQSKDLTKASGDILCSFMIEAGKAGGCTGTTKNLTKGFWRWFNYAEVYPSFGGSPVLQGLLRVPS